MKILSNGMELNSLSQKPQYSREHIIVADPAFTSACAAVYREAHRVAQEDEGFYVPAVLDYQSDSGNLRLENIPELIPLNKRSGAEDKITELAVRIGQSLGTLHRCMKLPPDASIPAPDQWQGRPDTLVAVHGDFSLKNIYWYPDTNTLALLGWHNKSSLDFYCTTATRYLDLVRFVQSLLIHRQFHTEAKSNFLQDVQSFLNGYQQTAGNVLSANMMEYYLNVYLAGEIKQKWIKRDIRALVYLVWAQRIILQTFFEANSWLNECLERN